MSRDSKDVALFDARNINGLGACQRDRIAVCSRVDVRLCLISDMIKLLSKTG